MDTCIARSWHQRNAYYWKLFFPFYFFEKEPGSVIAGQMEYMSRIQEVLSLQNARFRSVLALALAASKVELASMLALLRVRRVDAIFSAWAVTVPEHFELRVGF
jgi:hypothetical protein